MKLIDPIKRRLDTARHEAGHVVPFLHHRLPFKNVEILPDESQRTLESPNLGFVLDQGELVLGVMRLDPVAWFSQGCTMTAENRIIHDLSGVAGEQLEYEQPIWRSRDWSGRAKGDYQSATKVAKMFCLGSVRPFFKQAWEFLQQYKKPHAAITAALLDKSILTYAECVEIWGTL
jgi:hypothetical protein